MRNTTQKVKKRKRDSFFTRSGLIAYLWVWPAGIQAFFMCSPSSSLRTLIALMIAAALKQSHDTPTMMALALSRLSVKSDVAARLTSKITIMKKRKQYAKYESRYVMKAS